MSSAGLTVPFLMRSQWPETTKGLTRERYKPISDFLPPAEKLCQLLTGVGCIIVDACLWLLGYSYPIKIKVCGTKFVSRIEGDRKSVV